MERHPAVWDRLLGQVTGLCPCLLTGEPQHDVGHTPAARIGIACSALDPCTGRDRPNIGGHRSIWPPFGGRFASWVAARVLTPQQFRRLPRIRSTKLHISLCELSKGRSNDPSYAFYALAVIIVLH